MKFSSCIVALGGVTMLLSLPASAQINFDPVAHAYFVVADGTINSDISGNEVLVGKDDATNFNTLSGVTLTIDPGAVITFNNTFTYPDSQQYFSLNVFGDNIVNMEGGSASIAFARNTSTVNINGGNVNTAYNFDSSFLNINGGTVDSIESDAGNTVINGGSVTNAYNYSALLITGGTIVEAYGFNASVTTLTGGNLTNLYQGDDLATFAFEGLDLDFSNAVAGTNGGNPGVFYDMAWVRPDGGLVNATYFDLNGDVGNATPQGVSFTLVTVPEPGSLSLIAMTMLGGLGYVAARRRTRRS